MLTRLDISPILLASIGPVAYFICPAVEEAVNVASADMRAVESLHRDLARQMLVEVTGNRSGRQPQKEEDCMRDVETHVGGVKGGKAGVWVCKECCSFVAGMCIAQSTSSSSL
jgi:hypothetical protein